MQLFPFLPNGFSVLRKRIRTPCDDRGEERKASEPHFLPQNSLNEASSVKQCYKSFIWNSAKCFVKLQNALLCYQPSTVDGSFNNVNDYWELLWLIWDELFHTYIVRTIVWMIHLTFNGLCFSHNKGWSKLQAKKDLALASMFMTQKSDNLNIHLHSNQLLHMNTVVFSVCLEKMELLASDI